MSPLVQEILSFFKSEADRPPRVRVPSNLLENEFLVVGGLLSGPREKMTRVSRKMKAAQGSPDPTEVSQKETWEELQIRFDEVRRQSRRRPLLVWADPTDKRKTILSEDFVALLGQCPDSVLAKQVGKSVATICNWRKERNIPSFKKGGSSC